MTAPPVVPRHRRSEIREAVVALLRGATLARERVYANREKPIDATTPLPLLLIYTPDEKRDEVQNQAGGPKLITRMLTLEVQILTQAHGPFQDLIDDVALQVENVIGADPRLGGLADDVTYLDTSLHPVEEFGRALIGATIHYEVEYTTDESPADDAQRQGLDTLWVKWDIKPPVDTGESEPTDVIDLT